MCVKDFMCDSYISYSNIIYIFELLILLQYIDL